MSGELLTQDGKQVGLSDARIGLRLTDRQAPAGEVDLILALDRQVDGRKRDLLRLLYPCAVPAASPAAIVSMSLCERSGAIGKPRRLGARTSVTGNDPVASSR